MMVNVYIPEKGKVDRGINQLKINLIFQVQRSFCINVKKFLYIQYVINKQIASIFNI